MVLLHNYSGSIVLVARLSSVVSLFSYSYVGCVTFVVACVNYTAYSYYICLTA